MHYCQERRYPRVFLTTLPGLDAAMRLYETYGFAQVAESRQAFHGSHSVEVTLETCLE